MTSPQNGIHLTIVAHEDVHLAIAKVRDGWGDAYQKKAAVLHLCPTDLEKLGLKDNARVEIMGPAGSVIVAARAKASCEPGIGFMPSSLYINRLANYDPAFSTVPSNRIHVQVAPTDKAITPISDLKVRRNRA